MQSNPIQSNQIKSAQIKPITIQIAGFRPLPQALLKYTTFSLWSGPLWALWPLGPDCWI
jgi:hypothetical protein